jgi:hypothetical protein
MTDAVEESELAYETHLEPKCISKDEFGFVDVADFSSKKDEWFVNLHVRGSGLLSVAEAKELHTWLTEWLEAHAD